MPCTGPMYCKYNAVLRGFPKAVVDDLNGNTYTTTIHLIVSGVIKLSRYLPRESPAAYAAGAGMLLVASCTFGLTCGARNRVAVGV